MDERSHNASGDLQTTPVAADGDSARRPPQVSQSKAPSGAHRSLYSRPRVHAASSPVTGGAWSVVAVPVPKMGEPGCFGYEAMFGFPWEGSECNFINVTLGRKENSCNSPWNIRDALPRG